MTKWVDIARAEKGIKERPGDDDNPRILEYLSTVNIPRNNCHDEVPWCSAFVNWVFLRAGIAGTNSAVARSWLRWGLKLAEPRPGCVVILSRGTHGWQGHVGFYVGRRAGYVIVLGGNQNNEVSEKMYEADRVLGYVWPAEEVKKK